MGCRHANQKRELEMRLQPSCPFCREPIPDAQEERDQRHMKRVEANDPVSLYYEGRQQYDKGDYIRAFEHWKNAAELGYADAHYRLARSYDLGKGVEKDEGKEIFHAEEAAIRGHPIARCMLGGYEIKDGNIDRAVKHVIIAATQGDDYSIKALMNFFKAGLVEKDVLTAALRAHKAAVDATKSPQRKKAEEVMSTFSSDKSDMSQ